MRCIFLFHHIFSPKFLFFMPLPKFALKLKYGRMYCGGIVPSFLVIVVTIVTMAVSRLYFQTHAIVIMKLIIILTHNRARNTTG